MKIYCNTNEGDEGMDIEKIKEFLVVAECKDLLEAGDYLYISPSTLSRHIKALETEIGEALFTRTPRSLILNENGALFLPYATQILKTYESYITAAEKKKKNRKYRLYLGITPTIAQFDIEPILSDFQKEDGPVRLNIITESQENLIESLQNYRYDFIFLRSNGRPDCEFPSICCRRDSIVAVMAKDHPMAGKKQIHLKELSKENLMMLSESKYIDATFIEKCNAIGFRPKISLTSYLEGNLIDLAGRGIGVALLNQEHVRTSKNDRISVIPLVPRITSEIYVMFRSDTMLSNAEKSFFEHLKSLEE